MREMKNATDKLRFRPKLVSLLSRQGSEEGGKQFIKLKAEKQKRGREKKQQTKTKIK